jgi:maleylacetate reductase
MHVPIEVAERGRSEAIRLFADGLLTIGGGSAIGLGKAVALTTGLPIISVPTTYAGSEMTSMWGLTEGQAKRTGRDPQVLPRSVIYDADLTLGLPVTVSVTSGLNAVAHAVESLYAPDRSPVIALMAEEGLRSLISALPRIVAAPGDSDARALAQYGGWLCGACLGATTMGLHHKLCHTLGGMLDLPHAETHSVVLPYVLAYNEPAAPDVAARVASLLGAPDAAAGLWELGESLGSPRSLGQLGMTQADVDRVAAQVMSAPFANPRQVTEAGVRDILHQALTGAQPSPSRSGS